MRWLRVPQLVGDIARACVAAPAFQDVGSRHQHQLHELPDSSVRSEDREPPVFPAVGRAPSTARTPDFLVLLGWQRCLEGSCGMGWTSTQVHTSKGGSSVPSCASGSRLPQGHALEVTVSPGCLDITKSSWSRKGPEVALYFAHL